MVQLLGRGRGGGGSINYYEITQKRRSQQQQFTMGEQTNTQGPTVYHQQNIDTQNQEMEQPNVMGNESDFYDDGEYIEARGVT